MLAFRNSQATLYNDSATNARAHSVAASSRVVAAHFLRGHLGLRRLRARLGAFVDQGGGQLGILRGRLGPLLRGLAAVGQDLGNSNRGKFLPVPALAAR